jgi:hypothetical protein
MRLNIGKLSWRKVDNIILTHVVSFFILAAQSLLPHAIPSNSQIIHMLKNSKIVVFCPFDTGPPI